MRISKRHALEIVREEAESVKTCDLSTDWVEKVEHLSILCEEGVSKTHIAFLATAMLAKAVNSKVDLIAIKPNHAT